MGNNAMCKVVCVCSVQMKIDGMIRTLFDVRNVLGSKKNLILQGSLNKNGCKIICEGGVMKVIMASVIVVKEKMNGMVVGLSVKAYYLRLG